MHHHWFVGKRGASAMLHGCANVPVRLAVSSEAATSVWRTRRVHSELATARQLENCEVLWLGSVAVAVRNATGELPVREGILKLA